MKTFQKGQMRVKTVLFLILFLGTRFLMCAQVQTKPTVAVLGIESNSIDQKANAVSYMVSLELEKLNVYYVMDKYDVAEAAAKNNIDVINCFGKSCLVSAGKTLKVDKVITGSVERFGNKIIISLKLFDIKTESVEKQDATEYLDLQVELQKMIRVSVQKLLGITPDPNLVNVLINYDSPIDNPKTKLKLNGPRMGAFLTFGDAKKILMAPQSQGGFNMYPVMSQFGWQQEKQYLSAGNFQALVEGIVLFGGLESGRVIPSFSFLNGFRFGKQAWEFAFGPSIRVVQQADGFVGDGLNGTVNGQWYLGSYSPTGATYQTESRLDSRGSYSLSTSLVIAAGRTFRSGYLNIPVNLYVSPRKEGTVVGLSFGFNVYKSGKIKYPTSSN